MFRKRKNKKEIEIESARTSSRKPDFAQFAGAHAP
jgi:hypothetical protein